MARSKTQQSVSLFPFLAVLICTMGALILVLLLTTRQIREQAVEAAEQSRAATESEAEFPPQPEQATAAADNLPPVPQQTPEPQTTSPATERSQDAADSADRQQELAAQQAEAERRAAEEMERQRLVAEAAALQQQIEQTVTELDALRQQINTVATQQAELQQQQEQEQRLASDLQAESDQVQQPENLDKLSLQLATARNQLAALQQQQQDRAEQLRQLYGDLDEASETTRVAEDLLRKRESALIQLREMAEAAQQQPAAGTDATLIQFTNSSGTTQHPVIIELNAAGLVFQPSGVVLRPTDLEGFTPRESPLVAAILAAHNAQPSRPLMQQPYALLLVRPEGSLAFYSAQRILRAAEVHFGYELLETDRKVALESPAYDERSEIVSAIERAMQRRQQLYGDLVGRIDDIKRQAAAERGRRQLHVGADGQLREPDSRNRDLLPGRFYAGGVAPPRAYQQQREVQRQQREQQARQQLAGDGYDRRGPSATGQESAGFTGEPGNGEPASENIVRLRPQTPAGAGTAARDQLEELLAILEAPATDGESSRTLAAGSAGIDPAAANAGGEQAATAPPAGNAPPSPLPGPVTVNPFIGGGTGRPGASGASGGTSDAGLRPDADAPVARLEAAAESSDQSSAERVEWLPQSAPDAAVAQARPNARVNASPPGPAPASLDRAADSAPLDWSNPVTAPTDSNSRSVAAAVNSEFPSSEIPGTPAESSAGTPAEFSQMVGAAAPNAEGTGGPAAGSPLPNAAAAALSRFMAEAEQQKRTASPHPYLVQLLTGRPAQRRVQRVPVEVKLHGNLLQVGDLVAVDVSRMSDERLLEVTLDAISTELTAMPDGGRTAVPVLDFVVDQDARPRMAVLQSRLQQLDVPTRSIQQTASTPGSFVEMLKRKAALAPAASPVPMPPPAAARGGIRL